MGVIGDIKNKFAKASTLKKVSIVALVVFAIAMGVNSIMKAEKEDDNIPTASRALVNEVKVLLNNNDPGGAERLIDDFLEKNNSKGILDDVWGGNAYKVAEDVKEAYKLIIYHYISRNDAAYDAIVVVRLYELVGDEYERTFNTQVYNYLINGGMYGAARMFIDTECGGGGAFGRLETKMYVSDVVADMCAKGETEEAIRFVKKEVVNFSRSDLGCDYNENVDEYRAKYIKDMENMIRSYKP